MIYTMMQVCEETSLTYQTLKYYCNEGLVPEVKRDKNNRRVFDEKDIEWINVLKCLKKCEMSIKEIKHYLYLCNKGDSTLYERKNMLDDKKVQLLKKIDDINESLEFINYKQDIYDEIIKSKNSEVNSESVIS